MIGTMGEELKLMIGMVGGLELFDEVLVIVCVERVIFFEDIVTGVQVWDIYWQVRLVWGESASNHDVYVVVDIDYIFCILVDWFVEV